MPRKTNETEEERLARQKDRKSLLNRARYAAKRSALGIGVLFDVRKASTAERDALSHLVKSDFVPTTVASLCDILLCGRDASHVGKGTYLCQKHYDMLEAK